ncbi:2Fe-2S iron-sulfur cluster-binding protein [Streptomyces sp. AC512_CC834]|uniref:2Fe-2S iron-sulfur cluster-binding protein n=1 Tax=Streptomyces sp. AC512_CC834 TaxID=2823691 RepID=UPI001C2626C0|nr:2Fe-2S iron-sulfur cluster-binding protein [Streptomyces sp. AC512_CC834]
MTDDQHGDQYDDPHDDPYGDQYGDQHGGGTPPSGGRWDPLPQGDYDDGATAFVKLPEGGVDALLASSDSPLAAPGHGYVPPQITVTPATTGTDPAATGSWAMPSAPSAPVDGTQWQVPDTRQEPPAHQGYTEYPRQDPYGGAAPYDANTGQGAPGQDTRFSYQPGATGQWDFSQAEAEAEAAARPAPGQDVTGQWSIPVADGDLPDESGEFTTSSLAEQWGTGAPATLPGGAPAPWATQPAGQPWGEGEGPAQAGPGRERQAPGAPRAPEPAVGPYGQRPPSGSAVEAAPATAPGDETVTGAPRAPEPAVGPYGQRPPAAPAVEAGSATAPREETVTGAPRAPEPVVGPYGQRPPAAPAVEAGSATAPGDETVTGAPRAPEPVVGPYGQRPPAGSAVEAGSATAPGDRTVADGPGGAEEAPEGPAERAADRGEAADADSGPEAAAHPVTALARPGTAAPRERAPQPAPDRGQDPGRDPETEPRTGPRDQDRAHPRLDATDDRPDATDTTDPQADAADAVDGTDGTDEPTAATAADPAADQDPADQDPAVDQEPSPAGPHEDHPLASYVLRVNGADRPVTDAWIGESLLYVLRERLGLAGAKDGCSQGECGACNVQVDGRLVASCLVPAVTSAGSEVRTVEGLATDGQPSDVQRALARRGAVQCGFCVPGMAMTVHNLLEGNPAPTELEARQALCGNLCRCSGYRGVLEAVDEVVAEREAHTAAEAGGTDADEPRIPHQAGPGAGGVNPSAFDSQPPPGTPDAAAGPHDRPFGDQGQDGGHA